MALRSRGLLQASDFDKMDWHHPAEAELPLNERPEGPDIGPFEVISIDPGFVHLGFCTAVVTGDSSKKELYLDIDPNRSNTAYLVSTEVNDETIYLDEIQRWVWNTFTNETKLKSSTVLIERQYFKPRGNGTHFSHKLKMLQVVLYNVFRNTYQCNTVLIDSKQCKSALKIGTGTYGGNKTEAIEFARAKLNYHTEKDKRESGLKLDDHTADSVNQLYYHLQTAYPDYTLKFTIGGKVL